MYCEMSCAIRSIYAVVAFIGGRYFAVHTVTSTVLYVYTKPFVKRTRLTRVFARCVVLPQDRSHQLISTCL